MTGTSERSAAAMIWPLAMLALAGCAATPPSYNANASPQIAGHEGIISPAKADKVIDQAAGEAPDPQAYEALMNTVGSLSNAPLYKDSNAKLLIDGPATYAEMLSEIESAEHYVHLETYIFADDDVGKRFAAALGKKSAAGVQIRIIYDSLGSVQSSDAFFHSMKEAGIEVIEFHNVNPIDGGNPLDANVRDHRKLLIVDGRVAFTGGINLSNTYSSSSRRMPADPLSDGWRDTHVAIYGPAVAGFDKVFAANWREHDGDMSTFPLSDDERPKTGNALVAVLEAEGGDDQESTIFHAYREAMRHAHERIWITQAYFAPDKPFMTELREAASRGVDVRVIVPGVSDSELLLSASRSRYGDLLEAGVRIYENQKALLHAKTAVIDGVWSTVGSSNLDSRSFLHNDEINAVVFGKDFGGQMESQFLTDIEECVAISLENWKDRGFFKRLKELVAWPVEYWL